MYPSSGSARARGEVSARGRPASNLLLGRSGGCPLVFVRNRFKALRPSARRAWPPRERVSSKCPIARLQGFGRCFLPEEFVSSGRFLIQKTIPGKVNPTSRPTSNLLGRSGGCTLALNNRKIFRTTPKRYAPALGALGRQESAFRANAP